MSLDVFDEFVCFVLVGNRIEYRELPVGYLYYDEEFNRKAIKGLNREPGEFRAFTVDTLEQKSGIRPE